MITIRFRTKQSGLHVIVRVSTEYAEDHTNRSITTNVKEFAGVLVMMSDIFDVMYKALIDAAAQQDQTDAGRARDEYFVVELYKDNVR
jgi:hypothetical protein